MEITLDQFIRDAIDNSLVSADEMATARETLSPDKRDSGTVALAKALIEAGELTKYQAAAIYQRKAKGLVYGKYVVLDKLGAGGMGVVYKARHRTMDRVVALKVLSPKVVDSSSDAVKRFQQEVRAAAQLNHANIVTAHDADQRDNVHFLVMEYVEGEDLDERLKRDGPLPVDQAINCIVQAAKGLEYAHQKGIIHRDIKPANLLLDKQGTVKILDMGLARMDKKTVGRKEQGGGGLTQSGQIMGTCDYMAPEQAMDTKHATARSDIYSLGCTLYRLVIGQPPYSGDTMMKILMGHQQRPVPSLRDKRPDVPQALDDLCQRMMAKDPAQRPQTANELIADLQAYLGPGGAARPPKNLPRVPTSPPASVPTSAPAGADGQLEAFLQGAAQPAVATRKAVQTGKIGDTIDVTPNQETDGQIHEQLARAAGPPAAAPARMPTVQGTAPAPPNPAPRTSTKPRRRKRPSPTADQKKLLLFGGIGLAAVAGLIGMIGLAIVLTAETPWGTIVVEAEDNSVQVAVLQGGQEIQVVDADKNWTLRVDRGEYQLELRGGADKFQLDQQTVTVSDGDRVKVKVTLRPKVVAAKDGPPAEQGEITDRVPASRPEENEPPANPDASVTSPEIMAALRQPILMEFIETPLNDVARYLNRLHKIEIRIDDAGLAAAGMRPDLPLTADIKGVTLASALLLSLRQVGLVCVAQPDSLVITTPNGVHAWGGSVPGLTVPQPPPKENPGAAAERLIEALNGVTAMEFIKAPLRDGVSYLEDLHSIRIFVDEKALADAGIDTDTPITRNNIPGNSLRSALLSSLDQIGLTCVRQNEFLLITTPAEADFWGGALPSTDWRTETVAAGLKWLAAHQLDDGGWSCDHTLAPACRGLCRNAGTDEMRTAATALALLSFLMAGDTHVKGDHQDVVRRGLDFLVSRADETPHGASYIDPKGTMYTHGLATLALCQAYERTRDAPLKQPAQEAINFIVYAQDPVGGGWRYKPRSPGDTSVTGWQMLALVSGHRCRLQVNPNTIKGAIKFLDSVQANSGSQYGYTGPPTEGRQATTAIGLLCRMYLGWKRDHPALQAGVKYISDTGPSKSNMYYNYYATQATRAYGGKTWDQWQSTLRNHLSNTQATNGHEAGSWYFKGGDHGSEKAGRLYCTTMALMTLQVQNRNRCVYGEVTD